MRRTDNRAALTDEVARFQAEVRRLAFDAVRAVIEQELDRRSAQLEPVRQPASGPARRSRLRPGQQPEPQAAQKAEPQAARKVELPFDPQAMQQLELPLVGVSDLSDTAVVPAPAATLEQPPAPPARGRKRVAWTRESIVNELATWMLNKTAIDAPFLTRHGPPGLVAATRRVFGRFEAALNVAALHVSKLYPDGPPSRRPG